MRISLTPASRNLTSRENYFFRGWKIYISGLEVSLWKLITSNYKKMFVGRIKKWTLTPSVDLMIWWLFIILLHLVLETRLVVCFVSAGWSLVVISCFFPRVKPVRGVAEIITFGWNWPLDFAGFCLPLIPNSFSFELPNFLQARCSQLLQIG